MQTLTEYGVRQQPSFLIRVIDDGEIAGTRDVAGLRIGTGWVLTGEPRMWPSIEKNLALGI